MLVTCLKSLRLAAYLQGAPNKKEKHIKVIRTKNCENGEYEAD
jgi:hypothetical protein